MGWFPTVLDLCGIQHEGPASRRPQPDVPSLNSTRRRVERHGGRLHFQWLVNWAVRDGDWKLIGNDRSKKMTLHNLSDDDPEKKNWAGENPAIVERLKKLHDAWAKEVAPKKN